MPLPNGIHPSGRIEAACPDAALMGNRGILHSQLYGPVQKDWQHKAWVACRLGFGDWQRGIRVDGKLHLMASISEYSELFFLDEATAMSAGHRPCGTCRKTDYAAFKLAWSRATGFEEKAFEPKAVDQELHLDRCAGLHDHKQTFFARLGDLPDGVIFLQDDAPHLHWKGKDWLWTPKGYRQRQVKIAGALKVVVLTPQLMVEVLRMGYPLQVHHTAAFA